MLDRLGIEQCISRLGDLPGWEGGCKSVSLAGVSYNLMNPTSKRLQSIEIPDSFCQVVLIHFNLYRLWQTQTGLLISDLGRCKNSISGVGWVWTQIWASNSKKIMHISSLVSVRNRSEKSALWTETLDWNK